MSDKVDSSLLKSVLKHIGPLLLILLLFTGCKYFTPKKEKEGQHIARVGEHFLDESDLKMAVPSYLRGEDSIAFARNYINRWATKQLLLEGAQKNISPKKQKEFDQMVEDYKKELYSEAYKDQLITQRMDTVITPREIDHFYEENKGNFRLKEAIFQLRYLQISKDFKLKETLRKELKRFDSTDQEKLHTQSIQFKAHFLDDSIWVRRTSISERIPVLSKPKDKFKLKKGDYFELTDSLSLYLVFIKDRRDSGKQAPKSFMQPRIRKIILNKRKLDFAKKFEKDILKDALEDNKFEIYD